MSLPPAEVPKAPSSQPHFGSAAKAKDSSGRAAEPSLKVMPITVWSPFAQSAEPPPWRAEELGRKRFEDDGDGDSLLFNAELATSVVSSILGILILRGRVPYPLRKPWLYPSRG